MNADIKKLIDDATTACRAESQRHVDSDAYKIFLKSTEALAAQFGLRFQNGGWTSTNHGVAIHMTFLSPDGWHIANGYPVPVALGGNP